MADETTTTEETTTEEQTAGQPVGTPSNELTEEQKAQKAQAIAQDKINLITKATKASSKLQEALTAASDVLIAMQSRGYTADGTEPISETDLLDRQFTAQELHEVLDLFQQLRVFSAGGEPKRDAWAVVNAKVAG